MAITNTVMLYAVIVSLLGFALVSLAIWSRRELRMRLVAVALAIVMAPTMWFAFSEFPGQHRAMSADKFRKEYLCATIAYSEIRDKKGILMLAKHDDDKDNLYIFVSWDLKLVGALQKAKRVAAVNRKGTIVYGGASCSGDGEEEGEGRKGKGKKKKTA